MQLVEKAIRAGTPEGERPRLLVRKPLRFNREEAARFFSLKYARGLRRGSKLFSGSKRRESPRGHKAHESNRFRPELILRGARSKGHGFFSGSKSLERRYKVRQGFVGERRSGREVRKGSFDH
jgi:hypothetical protein